MGFLFFKTAKEKDREQRREKRHALRRAEGVIDDVAERIKKMEKDSDDEWARAKEAAKEGKQAAAQRALTSYRSAQVLITKLEQKKWVFKQVLMKLETAGTDSDFAKALGMMNKVVDINPELVEDVFDEAGDLLAEAGDTDKFWAQMYGKEVEGSKVALQDHIPSMQDLEKTLQEEVAGKILSEIAPETIEKEL
jgi:hypothetical protein